MHAVARQVTVLLALGSVVACTERGWRDEAMSAGGGGGEGSSGGDSATSASVPSDTDAIPGSQCGDGPACREDEACFEGTCVGDGPLRISLSWMASTDLDLHVKTPDGTEISYVRPRSDHGELDLDDCPQQRCRNEAGPHVENIVFDEDAPAGQYEAWVVNFDGLAPATFRLQIARPDITEFTAELARQPGLESETVVIHHRGGP